MTLKPGTAILWLATNLLLSCATPPQAESELGGARACTFEGKTYEAGARRMDKDDCNTCNCMNGTWLCTVMGCSEAPKN